MVDSNSCIDYLHDDSDSEDEFRSCCTEDEEDWQDSEESLADCLKKDLNEHSIRVFFKGVSWPDKNCSAISIVMERSPGAPVLQIQKKLDFYVDELVAEHLALMNGLLEAHKLGLREIFAFTDSEELYYQIAEAELLNDQLLVALGLRILEHADKMDAFDLRLVSRSDNLKPLRLAQEAVGIISLSSSEGGLIIVCPICYEEKKREEMVKVTCSHKFCASCMIKHLQERMHMLQIPIPCPQLKCKYYLSSSECKLFLPDDCYELLDRLMMEDEVMNLDKRRCPYPYCSGSINTYQNISSHSSSSSRLHTSNHVECTECQRFICINCGLPWHSSMRCEESQNLPALQRNAGDATWRHNAQSSSWRQCPQCTQMIEHVEGCYHMTCWCGYEFCYACAAEYRHGLQACHCIHHDEVNEAVSEELSDEDQESRRWEPFDPMSALDSYTEQERAQLATIQRFLAGGFGMSDQQPCQSPPQCSDSYVDAVRELHQLPWLESFVSVITDNYQEGFIQ